MKKDGTGHDLTFEKIADLYDGISLWKVHIERCREQDKNARVMDKETFDRLTENISSSERLESLPFGYIRSNNAGNYEFHIISGHHRIRAARSGGITELFVLVYEDELTDDEIKSKQLAHNALSGEDDAQVLKEIYDSISDVDEKIKSGVRNADFDKDKYRNVSVEDISLDFDYKVVKLMFLSSQMQKFDVVLDEIQDEDEVYMTKLEEFEPFAKTIRDLSKREDIRNVASLIERMCEITQEYLRNNPADDVQD